MTERSEIETIDANDEASFVARAKQCLDGVKALVPEELHCLLVCAVTKTGTVSVGILGNDMDIAKMIMTASTVARNGVVQANTTPNPTNEVVH